MNEMMLTLDGRGGCRHRNLVSDFHVCTKIRVSYRNNADLKIKVHTSNSTL